MDTNEESTESEKNADGSLSSSSQPCAFSCETLRNDLLSLFSSGTFYDCTFKVSNDATKESEIYRCHKVFLAACSEVFGKMLFGYFKEAKENRDYEINIKDTLPEVFELAMRFVYAKSTDFKNPHCAVKVYFFASLWMIPSLMDAVVKYLTSKDAVRPEDVLKVLEPFVDEKNLISSKCLEIVKTSTKQVLSDKSWLEAPEKVVMKVLQMKSLQISETSLFEKLCAWGVAQVTDNKAEARAKVDNSLKFIRFCAMDYVEFSQLCHTDAALNLLNLEEKYQIFLSITQKNSDLLPIGFSKEKYPRCLLRGYDYDWLCNKDAGCTVDDVSEPVILTVSVGSSRYLTGVQLYCLTDINAGKLVHLTCCVYSMENPKLCIISATFNGIVEEKDGNLDFESPVLIKKGICYSITVTYLHNEKLPSATFVIQDSYINWVADPGYKDDEELHVKFSPNERAAPPIIDICGLRLSDYVV